MLEKSLLLILLVIASAGAIAWLNRIELMLALIKFQTEREYVIAWLEAEEF